ncbi:MAG: anti-sigma factor family protein [Candidatus Dormibacteria bacterium]
MSRALTCGEARNLASELLDGELSAADATAVQDHVAGCQTCPGLYRAMVAVHERLHAMSHDALPPTLTAGLASALKDEPRP